MSHNPSLMAQIPVPQAREASALAALAAPDTPSTGVRPSLWP